MLKETHKSIPAKFGALIGGFLSGALSWIPFFNNRPLDEAMGICDFDFPEVSFGERFWFNFRRKWTFLLGALLGGFFFFLIPVDYLGENYAQILYIGLSCLAFGFLPVEIYQMIKNKKNDNLWTLLGIVIAVAICFWVYIVKLTQVDFTSASSLVPLFFLFFIASLFTTVSGQAIGSLFFLSSTYSELSTLMADLARFYTLSDHITFLLVALVGVICGYILGFAFKTRYRFARSIANGNNIGFSLSAIIILLAFKLETPIYTDVSTELAQMFVAIVVPLGLFLIAIALSVKRFIALRKGESLTERVELAREPEPLSLYDILTYHLKMEIAPVASDPTSTPTAVSQKHEEISSTIIKSPVESPIVTERQEDIVRSDITEPETESKGEERTEGIDVDRLRDLVSK